MNKEEDQKSYRAINIALAVILTSCVVLALIINVNTRDSRKEQLIKDEAALAKAVEEVEHREYDAKESMAEAVTLKNEANKLKEKYEKALLEAKEVELKSKLAIKKYDMINKQLIERLVGNERIEKERLSQIERNEEIRESLDTLYRETVKAKQIAERESAEAERAHALAENRIMLANQRKAAADASISRSLNYSRSNSLYHGSLFGADSYNRPTYRVYRSYRSSSSCRPSVYYQRGVYSPYR